MTYDEELYQQQNIISLVETYRSGGVIDRMYVEWAEKGKSPDNDAKQAEVFGKWDAKNRYEALEVSHLLADCLVMALGSVQAHEFSKVATACNAAIAKFREFGWTPYGA